MAVVIWQGVSVCLATQGDTGRLDTDCVAGLQGGYNRRSGEVVVVAGGRVTVKRPPRTSPARALSGDAAVRVVDRVDEVCKVRGGVRTEGSRRAARRGGSRGRRRAREGERLGLVGSSEERHGSGGTGGLGSVKSLESSRELLVLMLGVGRNGAD
jgi:hypothetical protein